MKVIEDDLTGAAVAVLLQEHLAAMAQYSPPESVHALDIQALQAPDITFYTAWEDSELLGCGALKELDPAHAEVKSMRTAQSHLRKGVASAILARLIEESRRRNYRQLSLETGSGNAFAPALALYERFGFRDCEPFAGYREDPFSRFMSLVL